MCGIFGVVSSPDPVSDLKVMGRALRHRGPDDEGAFQDGRVALGHRRLSIIDLEGGHQPMSTQDGKCTIVLNGEIYNFREVRRELQIRGHVFRTASDTEVVLHAYREWGHDCLSRFNGMFAFALWDKVERKLWLVRDRLGKKPLYLMKRDGAFYFASEAKALWALPAFQGTYDARAIDQYLQFRYVPGVRTFYSEIRKLPSGSWLLLDAQGQEVERRQWWSIPTARRSASGRSTGSYVEEFQELFASAVKLRLVADVPLGAFLSSGIDSASIAVEMARESRPVFFTIGFGDEAHDETRAAGRIARELGGEHHCLQMEPGDFGLLEDAVNAMDEPYGDPIILPTYLLARKAAEKVKVVLTGDGADEILGGYVHHDFFRRMPQLPGWWRGGFSRAVRRTPVCWLDRAFHYPASMGLAGRDRLSALLSRDLNREGAYLTFAELFPAADRAGMYTPEFQRELDKAPDEEAEARRAHFLRTDIGIFDKALQWDLRHWFPEQTLMKFDRLTMAHSLEGRCPYADHRLVEFFLKMPLGVYHELSANKRIVRDLYQSRRDYLPRKKKPFYLPMHRAFEAPWTRFQQDVFHSGAQRHSGWFRPGMIESLRAARGRSPLLVDKQIMSLAVLLQWTTQQTTRTSRDNRHGT